MLRISTLAIASILSFSACTDSQVDNTDEVDDVVDAKADGFTPMRLGTYDVNFGVFYAMDLHDDGTFHLQGGCRPNPTGPSCHAIAIMDGHYRFTRSGSKHYIRMTNGLDDTLAFHFRYVVSGAHSDKLALTDTTDSSKSTATLEEADKRQEGESCGGFTAFPGQCSTGLDCVVHSCCDLPGTCEIPADPM